MKKILFVLAFLLVLVGCNDESKTKKSSVSIFRQVCIDNIYYLYRYDYGMTVKYDQYTLLPEVCINDNNP